MTALAAMEGWTAHAGGPCPVSADTRVDVRLRGDLPDDPIGHNAVAGHLRWEHMEFAGRGCDGDIVAWRLFEEPA